MRQDVALQSIQNARTAERSLEPQRTATAAPPDVRLSMNQITTYRWSLFDDVAAYRDAGIPGIGVWRPKLSEFGEERGVDLLLESGRTVSSLSYVGGFTGDRGLGFHEAMDDARDAIHLAGLLQAECVVVVSGPRALHTARHARRLFVDALKSLGDLAGSERVDLAVLPMHSMFSKDWTFLSTIDDTLEILDRCRHPRVRMAFDAYHLWQEPGLIERIPALAPRTSVVRLSDWRDPPRCEYDRCLPGDGHIPLADVLRAFNRSGYTGFYEMEIWSEKLWAGDYVKLLEECCERFRTLSGEDRRPTPPPMLAR